MKYAQERYDIIYFIKKLIFSNINEIVKKNSKEIKVNHFI